MGLEKAATFVALDKLATAEATAEAALVIEAETQERAAADLEVVEAAKKAALDEQAAAAAAAAVEAAEAARDAAEKADTAEKLGAKKLEDKRCAIGRQIKPSTLACTRTRTRTRHAHASRALLTLPSSHVCSVELAELTQKFKELAERKQQVERRVVR